MKIQEFAQIQGILSPMQDIEIKFQTKMSIVVKLANVEVIGMSTNAGLVRATDNGGDTFFFSTEEIALITLMKAKK